MKVRKFLTNNDLRAGDAIVAKKVGYGILDHFLVYVGNLGGGSPVFMTNTTKEGVGRYYENEVTGLIQQFEPVRIRKFPGLDYERQQAVDRALGEEGKPYSWLSYNCEHFANFVQYGASRSEQVKNWGMTLGLVGLVFLASKID